jgi:hypothetical protein
MRSTCDSLHPKSFNTNKAIRRKVLIDTIMSTKKSCFGLLLKMFAGVILKILLKAHDLLNGKWHIRKFVINWIKPFSRLQAYGKEDLREL